MPQLGIAPVGTGLVAHGWTGILCPGRPLDCVNIDRGLQMELACAQILLQVTDLDKARDFYLNTLGLRLIESHPKMFAFAAGPVRFSVFGGRTQPVGADLPHSIMLRCESLDAHVESLRSRGVPFKGKAMEAPGFMRHIEFSDPDGNTFYLAEYFRDPTAPV